MSAILQPALFAEPPARRSVIGGAEAFFSDSDALLSPGRGALAAYDFALNPYRGCTFDCSYCYAACFVAEERKREEWGRWVEVKQRAVDVLRRRDLAGRRIYLSSATDPYQPIDREVELTRSILKELLRQDVRLVVQTRSPLVARDIDLLARFDHLRVNLSITTDDDDVRKIFEPRCPSIEQRLQTAEALIEAGITVAVCVSPALPMREPARFGRRLDSIGVRQVTASGFHQTTRPFAASTRESAIKIAAEQGWTAARQEQAIETLRRNCRAFTSLRLAFGPT